MQLMASMPGVWVDRMDTETYCVLVHFCSFGARQRGRRRGIVTVIPTGTKDQRSKRQSMYD